MWASGRRLAIGSVHVDPSSIGLASENMPLEAERQRSSAAGGFNPWTLLLVILSLPFFLFCSNSSERWCLFDLLNFFRLSLICCFERSSSYNSALGG
jgi:hypothetical protein